MMGTRWIWRGVVQAPHWGVLMPWAAPLKMVNLVMRISNKGGGRERNHRNHKADLVFKGHRGRSPGWEAKPEQK